MKKLSKLSIGFIIVQTILTLGTNWINFFMYYAAEKKAIENENTNINRSKLLVRFSYLIYTIVFLFLSALFVLNLYHPFYLFSSLSRNLKVISNHLLLFIFIFITASLGFYNLYKFMLKSIYLVIFRKQRNVIWMYIQHFISFIGKVFLLGIYELYAYFINKRYNNKKYRFTHFGRVSLVLMTVILTINLIFVLMNLTVVPPIILYLVVLTLINPFLNYGLYELKMKLILKDDFTLFGNDYLEDQIHKTYKLDYSFVVVVLLIFIVHVALINTKEVKLPKENFTINLNELNCNEDNSLCVQDNNQDFINPVMTSWYYNACSSEECDSLRQTINHVTYNYHNPDKIDPTPIIYTDQYSNSEDNTIYKSVAVIEKIDYIPTYYIYVETYYKKVNNTYIPLFNVIKNFFFSIYTYEGFEHIGLDSAVNSVTYSFSILENDVYIYSFLDNQIRQYDGEFINIDTSRLILDNFNIEVEASNNIFSAYEVVDFADVPVTTEGEGLSNFDKWTTGYLFALFDPLMVSSIIFNTSIYNTNIEEASLLQNVYDSRNKIDISQIQYPLDTQYIMYKNSKDIYVFEKDNNIYLSYNGLNPNVFINENGIVKQCILDKDLEYSEYHKKCLENVEYRNKMNLLSIPLENRIIFGENRSLSGSMAFIKFYKSNDDETTGVVSYELKTIQQYIKHEKILTDQITVVPYRR